MAGLTIPRRDGKAKIVNLGLGLSEKKVGGRTKGEEGRGLALWGEGKGKERGKRANWRREGLVGRRGLGEMRQNRSFPPLCFPHPTSALLPPPVKSRPLKSSDGSHSFIHSFYLRASAKRICLATYMLSHVRLSVGLSVTRVDHITVKDRIMKPHTSSFCGISLIQKF